MGKCDFNFCFERWLVTSKAARALVTLFVTVLTYTVLEFLFAKDGQQIKILGTLIVAISIPLMAQILIKEAKVSDFRQAWIDGLRSSVSAFYSRGISLQNFKHSVMSSAASEPVELEREKIFIDLQEAKSLILLRLNPEERKFSYQKYSETLEGVIKAVGKSAAEIEIANDRFIRFSQDILKDEWEEVKRGEVIYILIKFLLVGLILGSIASLVLGHVAIKNIQSSENNNPSIEKHETKNTSRQVIPMKSGSTEPNRASK